MAKNKVKEAFLEIVSGGSGTTYSHRHLTTGELNELKSDLEKAGWEVIDINWSTIIIK